MISRDDLIARQKEFTRTVEWMLSRGRLKFRCMMLGGIQEMRQEAWASALESFRDGKTIDASLTTFACANARWAVWHMEHRKAELLRQPKRRIRFRDLGNALPSVMPSQAEAVMQGEFRDQMESLLDRLEVRQRAIVRMRFGFDEPAKTLAEIGLVIGVTRERVRQIERRAMECLYFFARQDAALRAEAESLCDESKGCVNG